MKKSRKEKSHPKKKLHQLAHKKWLGFSNRAKTKKIKESLGTGKQDGQSSKDLIKVMDSVSKSIDNQSKSIQRLGTSLCK